VKTKGYALDSSGAIGLFRALAPYPRGVRAEPSEGQKRPLRAEPFRFPGLAPGES